jgi:hypothetical protein
MPLLMQQYYLLMQQYYMKLSAVCSLVVWKPFVSGDVPVANPNP